MVAESGLEARRKCVVLPNRIMDTNCVARYVTKSNNSNDRAVVKRRGIKKKTFQAVTIALESENSHVNDQR